MHTRLGALNKFSYSTGFHGQAKLFDLKFFMIKLSARWSNQPLEIILIVSQFTQCPALNETPEIGVKKPSLQGRVAWLVLFSL